MATSPITYRVSPEVDAELKRRAEAHGGVDRALRFLLGITDDGAIEVATVPYTSVIVESPVAGSVWIPKSKSPLLKPSEKKK